MSEITQRTDSLQALAAIKPRIHTSQTRAVVPANAEQLGLYWDIGCQLDAWQRERALGFALAEQMAQDLHPVPRTGLFALQRLHAFFGPQFEVDPLSVGQLSRAR